MKFDVKADPAYPAREEVLGFIVDGVQVEAIANYTFREIRIALTSPFQISGELYGIGFRPPLLCLKGAVNSRREGLVVRGLTDRDNSQRMAVNLYRLHKTRLSMADDIEKAQRAYLETRTVELAKASRDASLSGDHLSEQISALRQQLNECQITPEQYKRRIASFRKTARSRRRALELLHYEIKVGLEWLIVSAVRASCKVVDDTFTPLNCATVKPIA